MFFSIADRIRKVAQLIEVEEEPTVKIIEEPKVETALPKQRAPRRKPEHLKKWNTEDKTDLMKEYMREYRSDGKIRDTDGVKNVYVKKPNI